MKNIQISDKEIENEIINENKKEKEIKRWERKFNFIIKLLFYIYYLFILLYINIYYYYI
jgi:hypothetical protein